MAATASIHPDEGRARTSIRVRRVVRQLLPLFGFMAAIYEIVTDQVSALDITLFVAMYVVTIFGFEAGFHRFFSHAAFKATTAAKVFLGITGTMSGAGSILWWSTMHRVHHRFSDEPGDPHSPLLHGSKWPQRLLGWWHAYSGFLMEPLDYDPEAHCPDLLRDRVVVRLSRESFLWYCTGIIAPGLLALALTGSWREFAGGVIWGGLARIFCGRLSTLTVQCFGHLWGSRPYRPPGGHDHARNNILFVPGTLGMGWHNNHHAFPFTYSNSFSWWQLDPAAWGLRAMSALGLISDLRFPSKAALAARRGKLRQAWWYD